MNNDLIIGRVDNMNRMKDSIIGYKSKKPFTVERLSFIIM